MCYMYSRYGGPGRLKKACIKRQCVVISQMIAAELAGGDRKSPATSSHQAAVKTELGGGGHSGPQPASSVADSRVPAPAIPTSTLLSWPATHYTPTFQVRTDTEPGTMVQGDK